jgi:hypothetical protein
MITDRDLMLRWVMDHESWASRFTREIKAGLDLIDLEKCTPEDFTAEDRPKFFAFMNARKFDCHPASTRAQQIKNVGLMMREYIALKRIFTGRAQ